MIDFSFKNHQRKYKSQIDVYEFYTHLTVLYYYNK